MKTKRYTITTGSYDSYRILCEVEGAATPALSTLYQQFVDTFKLWNKPTKSAVDIMTRIHVNGAANVYLKSIGYKGDLGEQFVEWLVKIHRYKRVKVNLFHVDN